MSPPSFEKLLSANDVGKTGGHQAGILVPKTDPALLSFLPNLDPEQVNPDAWIIAIDHEGEVWRLRYIYYNNRLHGLGTRNEYRITHLTRYLANARAQVGDRLRFTATTQSANYLMTVVRRSAADTDVSTPPGVIRLSGWRRVH